MTAATVEFVRTACSGGPPTGLVICMIISSPCILLACIVDVGYHTTKEAAVSQKRKWKKRKADRVWKALPHRPNGTIITGALSLDKKPTAEPAVTSDKRAHRVLASVPPEIWREILYHATESYPAPCSIRDFSPSSPYSSHLPEAVLYRLYCQSKAIGCRLSRVCRAWRDISREFRFESIWITTPEQARALGKLISKEEAAGITGRNSCAWWIRSLRIDSSRRKDDKSTIDKSYWYKGKPFIPKCPRLIQYRHSLTTTWDAPELPVHMLPHIFPLSYPTTSFNANSLESLLKPPLRHKESTYPILSTLDWPENSSYSLYTYLQVNNHLLTSTLSYLQQLTIRSCSSLLGLGIPPRSTLGGNVHLPALHTFSVDNCHALAHPTTWDLPALRTLSIAGNAYLPAYEQPIIAFLNAHGSKLKELVFLTEFSTQGASKEVSVEQLCPNLEVLQLSVHNLELLPSNPRRPTVIKKLALMNLETASFHGSTSHVIKTLNSVKVCMPLLQILQDKGIESNQIRERAMERWETQQARPFITFFEAMEAIMVSHGVMLVDWRDLPIVMEPPDAPP